MDIIDTSFEVSYELIDVSAISDAVSSCVENENFADATKLNEGTEFENFMTLEHNFSFLDGTMLEISDTPDIAIFTSEISNSNGLFTVNPRIVISFSENHSTIGFTLEFAENYPLKCDISWYNINDEFLTKKHFIINSLKPKLFEPVQNFAKIIIEFTETLPYRCIKVNKIVFGINYVWGEDTIIDAKMVEESSVIADKISINTLDFSIYDKTDDFNLGNSNGLHCYIQSGQLIDSYEYIRGTKRYLGRKFIDKFISSNGLIKFSTVSYLGLMDKVQYYKGDIYSDGITAGQLIDSIMDTCNITDYEVAPDVASIVLYGTLQPDTCRNCLREILFATQSTIDTTGISGIKIYSRNYQIRNKVGRNRKINTKITKKEYISGVGVSYFLYELDSSTEDPQEIIKGIYPSGDNLITWDSPYSSISTTGGIIIESGKYYCIVRLINETEIQISGMPYVEIKNTFYKKADHLEAGQQENIKEFSGKLLDVTLAKSVADRIYNYYSYLIQLNIKYLADDEQISSFIVVENSDKNYSNFVAQYEKISFDLTGGYVADAQLVGYYNLEDEKYYADSELIADDSKII